jgi:hypothetical protein
MYDISAKIMMRILIVLNNFIRGFRLFAMQICSKSEWGSVYAVLDIEVGIEVYAVLERENDR